MNASSGIAPDVVAVERVELLDVEERRRMGHVLEPERRLDLAQSTISLSPAGVHPSVIR